MSKLTVYICHNIRGIKGDNATAEDMLINNNNAINFAMTLRNLFPNIDFYVPAEMDKFLVSHTISPVWIVEQLLVLDCAIIDHRDLLLVWIPDQYISNGMMVELLHASIINKKIAVVRTIREAENIINAILNRKIR